VTEPAVYRRVLLDTAPLVAIVNLHDSEHGRCVKTLSLIDGPLVTCWPVITEATWLLRHNPKAVRQLLAGPKLAAFTILELGDSDLPDIDRLFGQYADLSPQLADVALLHLAQREGLETVFTLDRRDFRVFRLQERRRLRLLPEDE
jgi:predicted nucleic acid-binding protein